ncbi:hypothetical protein MCOR02_007118 [Pyricularia oryzae]|uniref:Uncharacterized protein n=2 Tax=Pyricularia TaxID=48558 RepID=A0ABQ8NIU6_PYRGI|nr:hypothetical protein OOU_Y34scaffold00487g97 [Pyricularia oryzae Y34]KAH9432419.1 hypothetical protein MCOR02_007118 [Pyricularia oryzae]KAI6297737.1 hypothetical protein MCOR33_005986 [Pyricularia grisea]KAI6311273.1 hypothetical protein MCOR30_010907 [Pyricularia oryzae]KAI6317408.1 hypothetical protein MCOR29_006305 [Pyricularia oryzae]
MSCLAGGVLREEGLSQEDRPDKQAIAWMKLIAGTFITRAGCPEEIIQSGCVGMNKVRLSSRMACPSNYRRQSRWGSAAGPPASHGSRVHIFYRISVACPRLVKSWQTRQWPGSMDAP